MPFCPICRGEFIAEPPFCSVCGAALVDKLEPLPQAQPPLDVTDVGVAMYGTEAEAMLWADILRNENIPSVLVPLGPGAGWGNVALVPHELRVRRQDEEEARLILPREFHKD